MFRICASSLIVSGILAVSDSAVAQQPYPDPKGTWVGAGQPVTVSNTGKWDFYFYSSTIVPQIAANRYTISPRLVA
jgi:hypothetical protein